MVHKYIMNHSMYTKEDIIEWIESSPTDTKVEFGLDKKQVKDQLKDVQNDIDYLTTRIREVGMNTVGGLFLLESKNDLIVKKNKLKNYKFIENNNNTFDIQKAKGYPIEQLLDFDRSGFIKCLWHSEKTGSLRLDRKRNKAHCFAGCGDFDSIDVYMKINSVDFNTALKALS